MPFHQAGHQHLVGKARVQRVRPPQRQRSQVAHAQNAPVAHRHVRGLRLHGVHGEDGAGGVNGGAHGRTHKKEGRGKTAESGKPGLAQANYRCAVQRTRKGGCGLGDYDV